MRIDKISAYTRIKKLCHISWLACVCSCVSILIFFFKLLFLLFVPQPTLAILEGTVSLTRWLSLRLHNFDPKVTGSFVWTKMDFPRPSAKVAVVISFALAFECTSFERKTMIFCFRFLKFLPTVKRVRSFNIAKPFLFSSNGLVVKALDF